jgi:hypothetical protein
MTENEPKPSSKALLASITVRILYVAILTAALIVGGFVLLENRELHKVVSFTPRVHIGVLLGQALTIVGTNYFLASRASNFTDSVTEACIILTSVFASVSILGPYMFLKQVGVSSSPWWKPWQHDAPVLVPDTMFYFGLIPAGLCFLAVFTRLRSHSK